MFVIFHKINSDDKSIEREVYNENICPLIESQYYTVLQKIHNSFLVQKKHRS